jgi:PIN domain nuclease of toxin-antitoxin system
VRVVADSHAIVWYVQGSSRLSGAANSALAESERTEGIVVSVATLVDLWYVTQTTQSVSADDLARLRATLDASAIVDLHTIDVAVADAFTLIPRSVLTDPWDRFIVATAKALALPLVTRDGAIRDSRILSRPSGSRPQTGHNEWPRVATGGHQRTGEMAAELGFRELHACDPSEFPPTPDGKSTHTGRRWIGALPTRCTNSAVRRDRPR